LGLSLNNCFSRVRAGAPGIDGSGFRQTSDLSGGGFHQAREGQLRSKEGAPLLPWGENGLKPVAKKAALVGSAFPGSARVWTEAISIRKISMPGRDMIIYEYQHLVRQIYMRTGTPQGSYNHLHGKFDRQVGRKTRSSWHNRINDKNLIDGSRIALRRAPSRETPIQEGVMNRLQVDITIARSRRRM